MCAHPDVAIEPRLLHGCAIKRQSRSVATGQSIASRAHLQLLGSSDRPGRQKARLRTQVQKPQPLDVTFFRYKQQRLALWTVEQHESLPRSSLSQATGARHQIFHRIVRNHRAFVQSSQLIIERGRRRQLVNRRLAPPQPRHRETGQTAQQKQRQRFHLLLLCAECDHTDHVAFAPAPSKHDGRPRLPIGIHGANLSQ